MKEEFYMGLGLRKIQSKSMFNMDVITRERKLVFFMSKKIIYLFQQNTEKESA